MIIDTNVTLSRWPFRRLAGDETPDLVARLRKAGITQAWAGSFDALLHRDIAAVNERLAAECRRHGAGLLFAFGTVNPALPDWQEDLRRCIEVHKMRGLRLYPNYHGYALTHPAFAELLQLAAARGILVQIAAATEDTRTQHPLVRVPVVDLTPLLALAQAAPSVRIQLLNWWPALRGDKLTPFRATASISFDIAMVEGVEGIPRLLQSLPAERLAFGSHAPFFVLDAALLKMREGGLPARQAQQIFAGTAQKLLASPGR
ncbi:MAG: amidohydrolase family protein [Bryobacterales bacterium]|nr:amidohydrolase family protein [Bryobacterales bacterium]